MAGLAVKENPMRTPLRAFIALAVAVIAVFSLQACGLFESVQSSKVLAGSVLSTPEYDLTPTLYSSLGDGGLPVFDGSVPDGGLAPKVPPQVVAQVFFGERNTADLSKPPNGLSGATITLGYAGKSVALTDQGSGNYGITSLENKDFTYVPNTEYKLTIVHQGVTYEGAVTAPAEEKIAQFHVTPGKPLDIDANADLQLTRTSVDNIGFTTVVPVDSTGKGEPTYTDAPTKPLDLLDLVANDSKWKQKQITIKGTAFPKPNSFYVINVTAVARGTTSNNLFTTSALLAGTADIGMVKTRP
jgi:hypothetical protein